MSDTAHWSRQFREGLPSSGMAPYEEIMVPRVFEPWAGRLLDLVDPAPGSAVLDVACGPGTVTRLAAARVGAAGSVTGCDASPPMLAIAGAKPPVPGGAPIEYLECPAGALAVRDGAFDVVTCQHGLQFFPDRAAALAEMRRAARPGGRTGVAVWASIEESPLFLGLARAVERVLGPEAAATYRSGPWGLPDRAALENLAHGCGFRDVEVRREVLPAIFEGGTGQLLATLSIAGVADQVRALDEPGRARLFEAAEEELVPFLDGDRLQGDTAAHLMLGTA